MKATSLFILFTFTFIVATMAQNAFDTTFGIAGKAYANPDIRDMAVQPDDKIVTINAYYNVDYQIHLRRYSRNGLPDSSFGVNGGLDYEIPHSGLTFGGGIALQPDGKIVAVGSTIHVSTSYDYVFLRYLPDGTLDSSFANKGSQIIDENNEGEHLNDVALQPDGKIVACGNGGYGTIKVIRLQRNGKKDTAFGTKGIATLYLTGFNNGYSIAIQPDEKILVGGVALPPDGYPRVLVSRFTKNGSVDSSFGTNGYISLKYEGYAVETDYRGMKLLGDGNIIVGAEVSGAKGNDIVLARLRPDGSFDPSFATNGRLRLQSKRNKFYGLETFNVQDDGKIVIAGIFDGKNAQVVYRFLPNGGVDKSFGDNGRAVAQFPGLAYYNYEALASAFQNNGDILFGDNLILRYRTGTNAPVIAKQDRH